MNSLRYALRSLAGAVATLLVSSFTIFLALGLSPGDAATRLAGSRADAATIAAVRHRYGLDRPLWERYTDWLTGALHGDFGTSLTHHQSVGSLVAPRLEQTLQLLAYTGLLIFIGGIGAGVLGAVFKRLGGVLTVLSGIGVAIPTFVASAVLVEVFALRLGWFPALSSGVDGMGLVRRLTLPACALALSWAAYLAQVVRATVRENLDAEHVRTARSRGLREASILRRHILRNAAPDVVTVSGLAVAGLLAGAVVVEQAFGLGGIGAFLIQSVQTKDSNAVLAVSLLMILAFVAVTTATDIVHRILDPRVRKEIAR
ncbi:ABC transporter permease [Streptomyces sp. NPDC056390]|uniref:ABC transporter permease n=1 Tax=Streptomyces sp. NPDC056390 TaxID=3345806 RepID=UPI0035D71AE5